MASRLACFDLSLSYLLVLIEIGYGTMQDIARMHNTVANHSWQAIGTAATVCIGVRQTGAAWVD